MKKKYIKPESEVIELETSGMLAMSFSIDSESKGDYGTDFAGRHRGVWGNLWEKE